MIVSARFPAGILGLALEHKLRDLFASPESAAIFLTINGVLLLVFERFRRRPPRPGDYEGTPTADLEDELQAGARDRHRAGGGAGAGDLALGGHDGRRAAHRALQRRRRPLRIPAGDADHRRRRGAEAAGLLGSAGDGVRGQALVGAIAAAITTYVAVKFLLRFFETNRLTPFGIYCIVAGITCSLIFAF